MRLRYVRLIVLILPLLVPLSLSAQTPSSNPFCDGFEDGWGFQTRWTTVENTSQTPVASPVHSGDTALAFQGRPDLCISSMYRTDFEACTGEYSAWFRQESPVSLSDLTMMVMVQPDPNEHPTYRPGYGVWAHGTGGTDPASFIIRHNTGGGNYTDLCSFTPGFALGEWVRVFLRVLPGGTLVGGYERNGVVDSIVCHDPQPFKAPGRFYVGTCTGNTTDSPNYFDDVCYQPILCSSWPANDLNCDGVINVQDVVKEVDVAFRGGPPLLPCPARCE